MIYFDKEIKELELGGKKIKEAYLGASRVYPYGGLPGLNIYKSVLDWIEYWVQMDENKYFICRTADGGYQGGYILLSRDQKSDVVLVKGLASNPTLMVGCGFYFTTAFSKISRLHDDGTIVDWTYDGGVIYFVWHLDGKYYARIGHQIFEVELNEEEHHIYTKQLVTLTYVSPTTSVKPSGTNALFETVSVRNQWNTNFVLNPTKVGEHKWALTFCTEIVFLDTENNTGVDTFANNASTKHNVYSRIYDIDGQLVFLGEYGSYYTAYFKTITEGSVPVEIKSSLTGIFGETGRRYGQSVCKLNIDGEDWLYLGPICTAYNTSTLAANHYLYKPSRGLVPFKKHEYVPSFANVGDDIYAMDFYFSSNHTSQPKINFHRVKLIDNGDSFDYTIEETITSDMDITTYMRCFSPTNFLGNKTYFNATPLQFIKEETE